MVPERKKPSAVEDCTERPLNFFVADVESRAQIAVVLRKLEALVKNRCHPSCFETLKPKNKPQFSIEKIHS